MYDSDRASVPVREYRANSPRPSFSGWITRHPLMFWGSLWVLALSITVGATVSLLNAQLVDRRASLDIPPTLQEDSLGGDRASVPVREYRDFETWVDPQNNPKAVYPEEAGQRSPLQNHARNNPPNPQQHNNPQPQNPQNNGFPLWLMIPIAVGCATISLCTTLAIRALSLADRTPVQRLHPSRFPSKDTAGSHLRLTPAPTPRFQSQFGALPYQPPTIAELQSRVTVLPPEVATPLDSPQNDGNLVEQLDLRKRHSLSSLMDYQDREELEIGQR